MGGVYLGLGLGKKAPRALIYLFVCLINNSKLFFDIGHVCVSHVGFLYI